MLAAGSPASFVAWDLLALGDEDLRGVPQVERRARLEAALAGRARPPVHLTPATTDRALAVDWFDRFEGAGLDGVIAKRLDGTYQPGKRAMIKVKHQRTADCAWPGSSCARTARASTLLLRLYDDKRRSTTSVSPSFAAGLRSRLVESRTAAATPSRSTLARWALAGRWAGQRMPGAPSRWNARTSPRSHCASSGSLSPPTSTGRAVPARQFVRWQLDQTPVSAATTSRAVRPGGQLFGTGASLSRPRRG
jgi:hypothetical protein